MSWEVEVKTQDPKRALGIAMAQAKRKLGPTLRQSLQATVVGKDSHGTTVLVEAWA